MLVPGAAVVGSRHSATATRGLQATHYQAGGPLRRPQPVEVSMNSMVPHPLDARGRQVRAGQQVLSRCNRRVGIARQAEPMNRNLGRITLRLPARLQMPIASPSGLVSNLAPVCRGTGVGTRLQSTGLTAPQRDAAGATWRRSDLLRSRSPSLGSQRVRDHDRRRAPCRTGPRLRSWLAAESCRGSRPGQDFSRAVSQVGAMPTDTPGVRL